MFAGYASLSNGTGTFALEGCLLDEEVSGSLIPFDFPECDCSGSEPTFFDSSGDGGSFSGDLLGV